MQERLQKIIARAGVTSRRAAEELITGGRVRLNGRVVTELGTKADPRQDKVEVDGKRITAPSPVYVVVHKPRNVVSTMSDPEGRPSIAELLKDVGTRVYPVGRLDFATSGVLLATNDGEFSQGLLHPKKGVPKTYVVKVSGNMEPADLDRWAEGVDLEDGRTRPADVHFLRHEEDKTWFEITITEGRNQQLRRMGEATGFPVMRLARVAFAGVTNDGLRPGQWRFLTASELMDIRKEHGVPKRVRSADTSGRGGRIFGKVQARGESRTRPEGWQQHREERPREERPREERPREERPREERPRSEGRPPSREGRPRTGERAPEGQRPPSREGRPRTGERAPEGQRPPSREGRPRTGERAPEGQRPPSREGRPREGGPSGSAPARRPGPRSRAR